MDKLQSILTSIKDWFVSKGESKNSSGSTTYKWLIGLFVGALSLLGLAYAVWVQYKQGKELAKLKHEKDLAEEKLKQDEFNKKVAVHDLDIVESNKNIADSKKEIEELEVKLKKAEEDNKRISDEINAINDWDSSDGINKSK